MNHRDRILRTFRHQTLDKIVFQPRIMYWYNRNNVGGLKVNSYTSAIEKFVPREFVGKDITEIYDYLRASIRYPAETLGISLFYQQRLKEAKVTTSIQLIQDGSTIQKTNTPKGSVTQGSRGGYQFEHPVKRVEDLNVIRYLVENQEFEFNEIMFDAALEAMENYGIPTAYYFRSPYMRCILEFLGFETTIKFLRRYPQQMKDFLEILECWDRKAYKKLINSPIQLLNFGENIDCNLSPPPYFETYLLPYYKERTKWLRDAGKFTFIHMDGSLRDLLPYLADLPFDGIEAPTPEPQGDITLQELRDAWGKKVLLDGIPATLFMPQFPESRIMEFTQQLLEYFSPLLIVGVSDELPPNADGRRLITVAQIVDKFTP